MENQDHIHLQRGASDTIDLDKLSLITRQNWMWLVLIFLIINGFAYLFIRYTKNIYESSSEIKLDINNEASELGIPNMIDDKYLNIVSGEIEIIQSKLFLTKVLEDSSYEVSFYSVGRVLTEELFNNPVAFVRVTKKNHSFYNTAITFVEKSEHEYLLTFAGSNDPISGRYGEKFKYADLEMVIERNPNFVTGDEVGYYFVINSRGRLLDYVLANLRAEPLNYNANTIRVSFKDNNPEKAQSILNKIDTLYLKYSHEQKNLANTQKIEWLTNELNTIENRMEGFENYFENFTLENRTIDLSDNLKTTVEAINKLDSQRYIFTRRVKEIGIYRDKLKSKAGAPGVFLRAALPLQVSSNIDALLQLQIELEKMRLSYNEVTFAYQQKEKEVEILSQKLTLQLIDIENDWKNHLASLNRQKSVLENNFAGFPQKSTEFTKNQRFYKLYEELYLTLMQSKSQFEIAQAGTTPDFKILSPASYPRNPISPNRPMIIGMGLVASIVVNLFFLGILYLANNKITSLQELERTNTAPVVGSIPATRFKSNKGLHVVEHPNSMASEAMRTLRTNLDFFNSNEKQKIITVSSTVSGEGKSFIARNLGAVLALSKKKVVLVDLDLRKPKTHEHADVHDHSKGVSTILIKKHSWKECVINTFLDNLDFIPSGPHPPNPSELMISSEFATFLEQLKEQYDFIILDTPPVGLVTDGIMAMRRADISIYVFRANYSKRDFIKNLQRTIALNKFSNVTALLNALPISSKTYGYGYYEENRRKNSLRSILKV